ncbi:peptidoglycan-associated lipoprotein Pal [Verticiella sediminum]
MKAFAVVGFSAALAACGSSVPLDDSAGAGAGGGTAGGTVSGVGAGSSGQYDPFNPSSPLYQQRSVYFDFDSYSVNQQYRPVVEMHAQYLSGNPQQQVTIEGNTDERGSSEYNLALGQRRSEAVRQMLMLLGVRDNQVEAISFGKERPRATGTSESDYAENRRADFAYRR